MGAIDLLALVSGLVGVGFGVYCYARAERLQTALDEFARELRGAEEKIKYLQRARDQLLIRQRIKEKGRAVENKAPGEYDALGKP